MSRKFIVTVIYYETVWAEDADHARQLVDLKTPAGAEIDDVEECDE